MKIAVKVETGFNCNWRNIEPLQPEGFKGQTENEKETLKNSIVKNGFHDAFDVWKHDNKLLSIDGVHRKIALLELAAEGYEIPEQLPCAYIDAKDEAEAAIIILSRNSQHSHIIRAAVLMEACAIPAKMIEAVVPQKNLEAWSESDNSITEQLTAEEDDFEFEDGGIETDIVIGDLFEIGEHRLLCGDSTDSDSVAKLMNGEKADMVFTDPPYGMFLDTNYDQMFANDKNHKKTGERFDKVKGDHNDFVPELINTIFACFNYTKEIFIWGADYFAELIPDRINGSWVVWDKRCDENMDKVSGNTFELCWSKQKHKRLVARILWSGYHGMHKDDTKTRVHPTQKPTELAKWFFNQWGKENDLVADLFLGSGSTMVASHQLKRKCYGMELDPKYCQVIIDRMRKLDPTLIIKRNGVIYE